LLEAEPAENSIMAGPSRHEDRRAARLVKVWVEGDENEGDRDGRSEAYVRERPSPGPQGRAHQN
jgi:hypothetical protein